MRQVSEAELVWAVKHRLARLGKALRKNLASDNPANRDFAVQFIAEHLVKDAFGRFEVLSETPVPKMDLFSQAAYGTGSGSAPMYVEEVARPDRAGD